MELEVLRVSSYYDIIRLKKGEHSMGTNAKIKLMNGDKYISSTYYNMDGYVENFAPELIVALNTITPKEILKNRLLFQFLSNDYTDDDMLNYLCEVDISKDDYKIKVFNFDKEKIFEGDLQEFSLSYDTIM
jgi:hypothetical protein